MRSLSQAGTAAGLTDGRRARARSRWRTTALTLTATVLSFTALPAGAVVPARPPASTVVTTDWSDEYGGTGRGWDYPDSSGNGTAAATVDSDPATSAESEGVALIDTMLGYAGGSGAGTGIVLTSDGEVLTNYHVVEGATSIAVTIANTGTTYSATVVGHSESGDVALLKLAGASGLETAEIDDDTVATGDDVTAVGNAGGTGTLTAADGSVTGLQETITTASESTGAGQTLDGLIETDADVVPGDSGGPLLDDEGEVVGIDTAASTGSEINGYAVPIDDALDVVEQIRTGTDTTTVQVGAAPFLGVQLSSAGGWSAGATVAGLVENGPAAAAGLTAGDTITAVGGVTVTSADQLRTLLTTHDVGESVPLTWTDTAGESHSAPVTLAPSPVA